MKNSKLLRELTENLKLFRMDAENDDDVSDDENDQEEFSDDNYDDDDTDVNPESEIDGAVKKYVYKYLNDLLTNSDSLDSDSDDLDDSEFDDDYDDEYSFEPDDNDDEQNELADDDDQYYEYSRKPLNLYKSDTFNSQYGYDDNEPSYEEDEERITKFSRAEGMLGSLLQNKNMDRAAIIQKLESQLGITNSTAVSYYERILKKMGVEKEDDNPMGGGVEKTSDYSDIRDVKSNSGNMQPAVEQPTEEEPEKPEIQEWDDPDKQGIIRYVKGAHLVYKRQTEEGTFNELWVYKINNMRDETDIRKRILSGTDITPHTTQSDDNSQTVVTKTFGNIQLLHITGLPN